MVDMGLAACKSHQGHSSILFGRAEGIYAVGISNPDLHPPGTLATGTVRRKPQNS